MSTDDDLTKLMNSLDKALKNHANKIEKHHPKRISHAKDIIEKLRKDLETKSKIAQAKDLIEKVKKSVENSEDKTEDPDHERNTEENVTGIPTYIDEETSEDEWQLVTASTSSLLGFQASDSNREFAGTTSHSGNNIPPFWGDFDYNLD